MRTLVLADWSTVGANQTLTSITQAANDYLDMSPFEDAVIWLDVRHVTVGFAMTMNVETAPLKDEPFFSPIGAKQTTLALAVGVQVAPILMNAPSISQLLPVARWLRWRVSATSPSSAWSTTFRILVCVHARLLR
ncbi:MAG: hypothetical protein ABIP89_15885 [Polyangiaceae bacterium]